MNQDEYQIKNITKPSDLEIDFMSGSSLAEVCKLLHKLRSHLSFNEVCQRVNSQLNNGYDLVLATRNEVVEGVIGFRIASNLALGGHMHIEDFVIRQDTDFAALGGEMLQWLKRFAADVGCAEVFYNSSIFYDTEHVFLLEQGFRAKVHHFALIAQDGEI